MASRSAIIAAAAKAGRPSFAPQGANIGSPSPLVAQYANDRGYAAAYGDFLPRPPATFTAGAFGPMPPILPVPVDEPPEGGERPEPRRYEFQVGWNLPVGQPGSEGLKLADFSTLKSLADLYSVARTCIQLRKNEVRGLDWDILPTKDAAKAYHGDRSAMKDFGKRRAKMLKFWRHPDPDYFSFGHWLDALLEEVFVFDALSLVIHPTWGKRMGKGVLGSDLDCLELISGPTIRPLVGLHGEVPRPPSPAYQQYLYGVPRSDYMTLITQRDIDEGGLTGAELDSYRGDQLLYLPMTPRRWTPYGFPAIERALVPVMSGLQKQAYQLDYFREGTVPAVYISPGDANITPNQIRELQDALNAITGDSAQHHKVIVLPPGSKVDPQRPTEIADQFDEIVMTQVCMAFDVNPMELGILPRVSAVASPFAAREMAQAGRTIHQRVSTKPLLKFLADIFDGIMHRVIGQDDMKFVFEGLEEEEQANQVTELLTKQVQYGMRSVDECRAELQLQPWNLPETSGPVYFSTQMGPMPFTWHLGPEGQQITAPGGFGAPGASAGLPPVSMPAMLPSNPETTPAHDAAAAVAMEPSDKPGAGSPSEMAVLPDVVKQDARARLAPWAAEMENLARQVLRKGRHPSEWEPRYVQPWLLERAADVYEADGPELTAEYILGLVKLEAEHPVILKNDAYEWVDKSPKVWHGWLHDRRLAASYAVRLREAFQRAISKAAVLIRRWWRGDQYATRMGLVDLISDVIERTVGPVFRALWREAWHLGHQSAQAITTGQEPDYGTWQPGDARSVELTNELQAALASHGASWLKTISSTRMPELAQAISDTIAAHEGPDQLIVRLQDVLLVTGRAEMIAQTEVTRAQQAAALLRYRAEGVPAKEWITAHDDRVCAVCHANEAEGPIPLDMAFTSGDMYPPGHPQCRCSLMPVTMAEAAAKAAGTRMRVTLNGEQTWESAPADYPGAGGGAPAMPEEPIAPGGKPGGEPPRWEGPRARPMQAPQPSLADSGAGVHTAGRVRPPANGPAPAGPAGAADWWPGPRRGTLQPPVTSPGAGRGVPPSTVKTKLPVAGRQRDGA